MCVGLGELEDRLGLFQVPDDNLAVLGGRGQDVIHTTVPADGSNSMTLMEVGLARLELLRFLEVLPDILDKDFRATTSQ